MQTNYVWIITLLANVLIVRSSNVERPKRDLGFIRNVIANFLGYNTNNAIVTNDNNIRILYPVPNYRGFMNVMPNPYINRNIYLKSFPRILIPSNMVMLPVINFGRRNFPYITAFRDRNSKTAHSNLNFSPLYGNKQRVIPVPNHNNVRVPLSKCNDETSISCRKNITQDKTGEVSSDFSKQDRHKLPEFQSFRDTQKEISKGVNVQRVDSSQSPQSINTIETSTITPQVSVRKTQSNKTSFTTPSSSLNLAQPKLSSSYAGTNSKTKLMRRSTSMQPSSTNVQQLITTHAVTIGPTLTTSPPLSPLLVENVQKFGSLQPMLRPLEKKNDENKSTSMAKISHNNNFNSHNLSKDIVTVINNVPDEDTVFQMDNIKYPKNIEGQDDLMVQPSLFSRVIDVINSIAPQNIPQNTEDTLEEVGSDDKEVSNQSTDVYPSESEELDYLNKPPLILDEPSNVSIQEKGAQNKSNESEKSFTWFMPSDSARDVSRGDVPDM